MYTIVQYSDYRKGTTIRLHGYTSDKNKAIEKAIHLAHTTIYFTPKEFRIVKEVSTCNNDNEYVCLMSNCKGQVIAQYSASVIDYAQFHESALDLSILRNFLGEIDELCLSIEQILEKTNELKMSTEQIDTVFRELNVALTCELFAVVEMKEIGRAHV